MAISIGMSGMIASSCKAVKAHKRSKGIICSSASGNGNLMDQYRTLRVPLGASEKDVKKAFRQLALQYHPDVCKGSNCNVQFHRINEAYDIVMNSLRESQEEEQRHYSCYGDNNEWKEGDYDEWDLWEEWMGWEGAGIRDYSSHINPYI